MLTLAVNVETQGDIAAAESIIREALDITRIALGPEHPRVALMLRNLATNLSNQGKYVEALEPARASYDIRRRVLGERNRETVESLSVVATTLKLAGRNQEAERLLRQVLATARDIGEATSPQVVNSQLSLGDLLCRVGGRSEGVSLLTDAHTQLSTRSPQDLNLAFARGTLGECLTTRGRYREAEPLLISVYDRMSEYAATHPWRIQAARRLADLYQRSNRPAEEAKFRALLPAK
jgi:tetratricopeptide (TPR) repeat protein